MSDYTRCTVCEQTVSFPEICAAIDRNDLKKIKKLMNTPKLRDADYSNDDNPLHIAITKQRREIFDYLLMFNPAWQSSPNSQQKTPLAVAVGSTDSYFFQVLSKNGINIREKFGYYNKSLLHLAVEGNAVENTRWLLENGADVNAVDKRLRTPLILSCYETRNSSEESYRQNLHEIASMLLYYNSNALITDSRKNVPFGISVVRGAIELQNLLYNFTYDQEGDIKDNHFLIWALMTRSPFFRQILERTESIKCRPKHKARLAREFGNCKADDLKLFVEKFPQIVEEIMQEFDIFSKIADSKHAQHVMILLKSCLGAKLVESSYNRFFSKEENPHFIAQLCKDFAKEEKPLDVLTQVVCGLLSCGLRVSSYDVHVLFYYFGDCELFKVLLHMDIEEVRIKPVKNLYYTALCALKCTVLADAKKCIAEGCRYCLTVHRYLFEYTMVPELRTKEIEYPCRDPNYLVTVKHRLPCLQDLARNAARKHIIDRFEMKKSWQLYTAINQLPVPDLIKKILRFEVPLYNDHEVRLIQPRVDAYNSDSEVYNNEEEFRALLKSQNVTPICVGMLMFRFSMPLRTNVALDPDELWHCPQKIN